VFCSPWPWAIDGQMHAYRIIILLMRPPVHVWIRDPVLLRSIDLFIVETLLL
jgi:hypothetical protein